MVDKPSPMPRREPGRLEPFVALSLALHALVALLLPRWWEAPRIRLSMAQGAIVQVLAVPLPPRQPPAPPSAREAPDRIQTAVRSERAGQSAAAQVVAQRSRPSPRPQQASPPASAPPARDQRPRGAAAPGPSPAQERLTSPRSPVTVAAAVQRSSESAPSQPLSVQAAPEAADPRARAESQGSEGTREAPSGPAVPEPVPAAAVLPRGGLQPPSYPKDALSRRLEGRVVLRLTVGPDGSVQQAEVLESSGWRDFDAVASHFARRVAFRPATTGTSYRLAMEFVFALRQDAQGRVEPSVEVRPLGNLEFLSPPKATSSV